MLKRDPLKPSRCRVCRADYVKRSMTHKVCGPDCAQALALEVRNKAERRAAAAERVKDRAKRETLKTRQQWLKEAQTAFNSWIRWRDRDLSCISCGRHHRGAHDAGHYRSVGAMPALRFHEDNVAKQCVPCNQHKSGNVLEYRIGLLARIGAERVAFLEGPHEPAKHTIEDAKRIKAEYKAKLKQLTAKGECE